MYIPLIFTFFYLISNIFINIHEYANLIICISEHWIKVLCLNIKLVPSLKVLDEFLLRYEYFCRDIPIIIVLKCQRLLRHFNICEQYKFDAM